MQEINPMNELVMSMRKEMQKTVDSALYGTGLALGTKTANGVLVDGQKNEFSGSDCMIIEHIVHIYETETANGPEPHTHKFDLNDIVPGDRVLVAILNTICVIIGKVV